MPIPSRVSDLAVFDLLLSVARLGSVGAAAREHGITQPAASIRLSTLERRLRVPLLERSTRGSRLTEEGALVADWARTAIDAAQALDAGIIALHRSLESRLPVAASLTVAEYLMPRWIAAFHASAAQTSVSLTTGNSEDVAAAVLSGSVHIGFIEGPEVPVGLHARTVARDTLTVVVSPRHPWARRRSGITPRELANAPLLSRENGSGTRRYLELALVQQAGMSLAEPLLELSSATAIKAAVAEDAGPAVLSSLAVASDVADGTVVCVPVTGLDLGRALRLVYPKSRALTGPARELAAIARRCAGTAGR